MKKSTDKKRELAIIAGLRTPFCKANGAMRAAPAGLRELYLSRTSVGDLGVAALGPLRDLEALGLAQTPISDVTLARVARLTGLRTLVLNSVRGSPQAFAGLGALTALERLLLEHTAVGDDTMAALEPLRGLRVLHLHDSQISDVGLATARKFEGLEELTIGDTAVTRFAEALPAWPLLRSLSVYGLPVTDGALPSLLTLRRLTLVNLGATDVTDPSALGALPRLRSLGLSETKLRPGALAGLGGAALLTELSLAGAELPPGASPRISQLRQNSLSCDRSREAFQRDCARALPQSRLPRWLDSSGQEPRLHPAPSTGRRCAPKRWRRTCSPTPPRAGWRCSQRSTIHPRPERPLDARSASVTVAREPTVSVRRARLRRCQGQAGGLPHQRRQCCWGSAPPCGPARSCGAGTHPAQVDLRLSRPPVR